MRSTLILAVSILLGFVALGTLWQPAPAQQKVEPVVVERYRVRRINDTYFVLVDSATGRCWARTAGLLQWHDLGTPPK
jgi:hypothetical protein